MQKAEIMGLERCKKPSLWEAWLFELLESLASAPPYSQQNLDQQPSTLLQHPSSPLDRLLVRPQRST